MQHFLMKTQGAIDCAIRICWRHKKLEIIKESTRGARDGNRRCRLWCNSNFGAAKNWHANKAPRNLDADPMCRSRCKSNFLMSWQVGKNAPWIGEGAVKKGGKTIEKRDLRSQLYSDEKIKCGKLRLTEDLHEPFMRCVFAEHAAIAFLCKW